MNQRSLRNGLVGILVGLTSLLPSCDRSQGNMKPLSDNLPKGIVRIMDSTGNRDIWGLDNDGDGNIDEAIVTRNYQPELDLIQAVRADVKILHPDKWKHYVTQEDSASGNQYIETSANTGFMSEQMEQVLTEAYKLSQMNP